MNTATQQMSSDQIMDLLRANDIDVTTRDLGSSGGGDWWAIEVPAARDCFLLITPAGYPYDLGDDDDAEEFLCVQLYAGGEYEDDLGDRPWSSFGTDDTPATPDAILAAIAAARTFSETWDGESK
jgi:hypothetical protein